MSPDRIKGLMAETGGTPTERCVALLIASGITAAKDISGRSASPCAALTRSSRSFA
jgi:hypothetical protein